MSSINKTFWRRQHRLHVKTIEEAPAPLQIHNQCAHGVNCMFKDASSSIICTRAHYNVCYYAITSSIENKCNQFNGNREYPTCAKEHPKYIDKIPSNLSVEKTRWKLADGTEFYFTDPVFWKLNFEKYKLEHPDKISPRPRKHSPRHRSPRKHSPRHRSPRHRSPRHRSPRKHSPRHRSPSRYDRSLRHRSPYRYERRPGSIERCNIGSMYSRSTDINLQIKSLNQHIELLKMQKKLMYQM